MTRPLVLTFGGELLSSGTVAVVAAIRAMPPHLLVVDGGGRGSTALNAAGIERQVEGLRITDEPTLDVVVSVLAGAINTRLVAALAAAGVAAVG